MTKAQFNEIKAKLDETKSMIDKAKMEATVSIDSRIVKVRAKIIKDIPKLWNTVDECGMTCVTYKLEDGREGYCKRYNEKKHFSGEFEIRHPGDIIFEIDGCNPNDPARSVEAKVKEWFADHHDSIMKSGELLRDLEDLAKSTAKIQDAIRISSLEFFKEKNDESMKELQHLQSI